MPTMKSGLFHTQLSCRHNTVVCKKDFWKSQVLLKILLTLRTVMLSLRGVFIYKGRVYEHGNRNTGAENTAGSNAQKNFGFAEVSLK